MLTHHLLRIDIHLATINGGKVEAVQIGGDLAKHHHSSKPSTCAHALAYDDEWVIGGGSEWGDRWR
jgi:hypothetical protein